MTYRIVNDRLAIEGRNVRFVQARDVGGRITPTMIVLHDTAGGLNADGSISWLAGNPNKTSAHFVVALDGTITQLAPPDRKCNHAGRSSWRGREMCNGFSVGIEIVNPGKLLPRGNGAVSSAGTVYDGTQHTIRERTTKAHGSGLWMAYSHAQIEAVRSLVEALARAYPSITEVVGHHDISPGRKVDPTPLMPWDVMRQALQAGRAGASSSAAIVQVEREAIAETIDVQGLQERLRDLGYYTGIIDDRIGSKLEGAVYAFQRENGLKATGRLDPETVTRIESPELAKPMPTGHREETPPTALAENSTTMKSAIADVKDGQWQTALAAVTGFLAAVKALVAEAGVEILIIGSVAGMAYFAWKQMKRGHEAKEAELAAYRAGLK